MCPISISKMGLNRFTSAFEILFLVGIELKYFDFRQIDYMVEAYMQHRKNIPNTYICTLSSVHG